MSKAKLPSTIILSIAIVISGYFIGQTYVAGKKLDRTVTVKGLAEREVEADIATWPLQLTVSGNDLGQLQQTLEKQTKVLQDFFASLDFTDAELTVGAPTIQDNRALLYGGQSAYNQDRYIAKVDFNLRTTKLDKMSQAMYRIPSIIGQGLVIGSKNTWQPVQYLYTKLNEIKPGMIEEATKNAREAAEKFARDSGSKVGKIKTANQGLFSINDLDPNSGVTKKVRIVSTLQFYIED
ncbi:SIMPL domain-containing protein [Ekhidna sp. To15]|uniref:SIMPL domain-containing protein n=1 Tax=Ekhidna sp. To15 TaxID=3395267 RepID=UPI003F51FBCA